MRIECKGCPRSGNRSGNKRLAPDPEWYGEKMLTPGISAGSRFATGHCYAVSTTGIRFGPYLCTGVDLRILLLKREEWALMTRSGSLHLTGTCGCSMLNRLDGKGFVTFNADLKEIPSPPLRIILMYEQDKKPVSYDDGGPARIAIISENAGVITEGSAWVKWVNKIEIKKK